MKNLFMVVLFLVGVFVIIGLFLMGITMLLNFVICHFGGPALTIWHTMAIILLTLIFKYIIEE